MSAIKHCNAEDAEVAEVYMYETASNSLRRYSTNGDNLGYTALLTFAYSASSALSDWL